MKIGIVNYSLGNVGSVYSAFKFYKFDVVIVNKPENLEDVDVIVLSGVGNFKTAVSKLKQFHFWDKLNDEVIIKKKPILGICLGMQLFADVSFEDGNNFGFGWIKGKVQKIKGNSIRVPHIGWDEVRPLDEKMFKGIINNFFYFMHSYHLIPEDKNVVIATTKYGDLEIVSALRKDNIVGVQFHPEKSQGDGLRIIRNFLETIN
ncbi:MAG: imidazole glycerol phosphate synthase subunit HisH [Candidatus Methanoperedens sp.]|nr:imidazole glycerol phosphate synthase subunit HisH [Candidatus Methanoperedens sp.]CAG0970036.1 glutamine amidotransferase [Methanosarcinales archaeon]